MAPSFAHLVARSGHSLLCGTLLVDELVREASRLGYEHLALTDRNSLAGAPRFLAVAREAGLHPVLGLELEGVDREGRAARVVALARNVEGYSSLCTLVSQRQLGLAEGRALQLEEALAGCADGLFLLTEDLALAQGLRPHLESGILYLRLVRPGRSESHERRLLEASPRLRAPVVASGDVAFREPAEHQLHRLLLAIRRNRTLDEIEAGDDQLLGPGSWLQGPAEMARLFVDQPRALALTLELARACNVPLPPRGRILPTLRARGEPGEEPASEPEELTLRRLCEEGIRWRYGFLEPRRLRERLQRELDLIIGLGFAGTFLVVHEIVMYARRMETPVAGRGSGGSSLVAYLLGITNVDPLRFRIAFERFLNEGRQDAPDLDIDFSWRDRDQIIEQVYERFGRHRVAMVCTHVTFQERGAFRETARVLGLSDEEITRLRRQLPRRFDHLPLPEALALGERADLCVSPTLYGRALQVSRRLQGLPRHLSVHPGGIIITPDAIQRHAPLQRAAKGVVVTQYNKDGVEDMGLVKIDLLGNRALATTREAVELVHREEGVSVDVERLPDCDPATVSLLRRGDTVGCNQLESPAMRHLLVQMQPGTMREIMQTLALIRPGAAAIGAKEEFILRQRGEAAPLFACESLRPILGESHGIMLYEDDTMLVAQALGGLDGVTADRLRKGITKARTDELRRELSREFLAACDRHGAPRPAAEHMWVQMAKFNSYSFCKAHAASYAMIAYAGAYLKAHHPLSFWVAALNNNQGMYEKRVYVEEARRRSIAILGPCVQCSGAEFTRDGTAIRVGLGQVRGLSQECLDQILAGRPFSGLQDLLLRTRLTRPEVEHLISCGACDSFGLPRPRLLLEAHLLLPGARLDRGAPRIFRAGEQGGLRQLPTGRDWDPDEKFRRELALLELSVREHPLAWLRRRPGFPGGGGLATSRAVRQGGRRVRLLAVLDALRYLETEAGDGMEFLTFEDEWGIFEVALFPEAYATWGAGVRGWGPYLIGGTVEEHHGALSLHAHTIRSLAPEGRRAATEVMSAWVAGSA